LYKPNFCAECGTRVERAHWRVWTNRRFCANCAGRFRKGRIITPLVLCAALISGGFLLGRAVRHAAPPLIVGRGELSLAPVPQEAVALRKGEGTESAHPAPRPEPAYGPDGTPGERPTDPDEIISICGARTKKGTPCQRRVRGTRAVAGNTVECTRYSPRRS